MPNLNVDKKYSDAYKKYYEEYKESKLENYRKEIPYIMSKADKKLADKMAEAGVDVTVEAPGVFHVTNKKKQTPSYKKGGKVKKTGLALLHKGEVVLPVNSMRAMMEGDSSVAMKVAKKGTK